MCTEAALNANSCPAASQVGTVSNDVTLLIADLLPIPQTVNESSTTSFLARAKPRASASC